MVIFKKKKKKQKQTFLVNNFIMTLRSQEKNGQEISFFILSKLYTETMPEIKLVTDSEGQRSSLHDRQGRTVTPSPEP